MSYFNAERPKTKVELTDPNYWVEVYSDVTYKEQKQLASLSENPVEASDQLLLALLVDWNLDNEDGTKAELNQANLDRLRGKDTDLIISKLASTLAPDQKKSSTSKQ